MELKKLQDENAALQKELLDSRTLYNQLVQETSQEKFDERRINLLKSQVIQLERQLLLMSDALSSRSRTLLEIENSLSLLADHCRSLIALDVKGPAVPVPRSSLTEMVEKLESARIRLYKNIENTSQEALSKPMMFFNNLVKPDKRGDITLFDICSGSLDHVNLKQVAKLESRLCQLYKDLISVHHSLTSTQTDHKLTTGMTCPITTDRLTTQVLKAMARLEDCTQDLLALSLLYPTAPWPTLKRPVCGEITSDKVISSLPTLPRSKAGEVQQVIEALTKVTNHRLHTREQELKALQDEVKFHNAVYSLQSEYMEALFEAVRTGYSEFEVNVEKSLCQPMIEILHAYEELKNTSSEEALRAFLKAFKDKSEILESTISSLSQSHVQDEDSESTGLEGLSAFKKDFFMALNKRCDEVRSIREQNIRENKVLREEQDKLDSALASLLEQTKASKESVEENSSARKMLQKNREEGPQIEFKLKIDSGNNAEKNSEISSRLDALTLSPNKSDMSDCDSSSVSSQGSSNMSKLRPPSSGLKLSPTSYSKNRTLNLRRSGSLSGLSQSRSGIPSSLSGLTNQTGKLSGCVTGGTEGPVRRTSVETVSDNRRETKESDSTRLAGNVTANSRRKIPTLKTPFR